MTRVMSGEISCCIIVYFNESMSFDVVYCD